MNYWVYCVVNFNNSVRWTHTKMCTGTQQRSNYFTQKKSERNPHYPSLQSLPGMLLQRTDFMGKSKVCGHCSDRMNWESKKCSSLKILFSLMCLLCICLSQGFDCGTLWKCLLELPVFSVCMWYFKKNPTESVTLGWGFHRVLFLTETCILNSDYC